VTALINLLSNRYTPGHFIKPRKMGSIVIYYHVNSIDRKYHRTYKDCLQMRTVGCNGLRIEFRIDKSESWNRTSH